MNLILHTKTKILFLFLCVLTWSIQGQDFDDYPQEFQDSVRATTTQRYAIFTIGGLRSVNTENSAYGKGTDPEIGLKLGAQLFLYDRFFIGLHFNSFTLEIKDKTLIGNFDNSTVSAVYFELGYEFELNKYLNLGLSFAPLGEATYKNSFSNRDNLEPQTDTANLIHFNTYLRYNFSRNFSIFASYSFRNDNLNIETAPEIQNQFDKVQYHNFGFGLKYAIGLRSMFKKPPYQKD